jgi:cation:H+ antiporter
MIGTTLFIALIAFAASVVLYRACSSLEESSHRIAARHGIPDIVKGSLLTAISSSVPELATAVLAVSAHNDFELGLSAIIGSAIYNILVIPACSVFARGKSLSANRDLVFREAQFYLVSVIAVLLVISLAVIYDGHGAATAGNGEPVVGTLTSPLALLLLALYGLYVFIQIEEGILVTISNLFPVRHFADALQAVYHPDVAGPLDPMDLVWLAGWGLAALLVAWRTFSWEPRG